MVFTLGSINLVVMEKTKQTKNKTKQNKKKKQKQKKQTKKTVATLCVPDVRETFSFSFCLHFHWFKRYRTF